MDTQPPSPARMQEMFAVWNAWKAKFNDNVVDMGGKLKPSGKVLTASGAMDGPDSLVLPHLGDFFIDRLMDSDVREWQARLAGKFAAATVNGALVMLRMVLADAVAEFQLAHDPTTRIKRMPKRRRPDEDPNVLSATELGKVMAAFREVEPEHYPLGLTLALTGLRYGEATALRWSDVDEEGGVIRIVRAQWHGIVGETKTGSVRSVPLTAELAEVLRDHRRTAGMGPEGWVFSNADGGLLRPGAIRAPLRRALKRAAITKRVTVHGLRRTFNNLSRQVAGAIVTRAITGHVTEEMTEHYSHVDRAEKLHAANQVVALAGLRATPANDTAVTAPNASASGGSGGGLN